MRAACAWSRAASSASLWTLGATHRLHEVPGVDVGGAGAWADLEQAVALAPDLPVAHCNRGAVKFDLHFNFPIIHESNYKTFTNCGTR